MAILLVCIGIVTWNISPVFLDQIDVDYVGKFRSSQPFDKPFNYAGVQVFKKWLERRARPSMNPLKIAWQHLWYNCITSGYDLEIWVETEQFSTKRDYAVYFSGQTVFLRVEPDGWNQVLQADFTPDEFKNELSGYFGPLPAEVSPVPAQN